MFSQEIKDNLNARLHIEVLKLSSDVVDYSKSKEALTPTLDEIVKDGWIIKGFTGEDRKTEADWETSKVVCIQRSMAVTSDRENGFPYDSVLTQVHYEVIGNNCVINNITGEKQLLDDNVSGMALCVLAVKAIGPKPSNFIEDL